MLKSSGHRLLPAVLGVTGLCRCKKSQTLTINSHEAKAQNQHSLDYFQHAMLFSVAKKISSYNCMACY